MTLSSQQAHARDRRLIFAATSLRAFANGLVGVLLGIYIAKLGLPTTTLGVILSAGMAGAFVGAWVSTFHGDRIGRRRLLFVLGVLLALASAVIALASSGVLIGAAAFLGAVTGMGKDRGAMLALESAMLPATTDDRGRTRLFAWYAISQDVAQAAGGLAAAGVVLLRDGAGFADVTAYRTMMVVPAVLVAISLPLYIAMSTQVESPHGTTRVVLAPQSRRVLTRISALFMIDSIGGGFLGSALFSYFFHAQFGASEATIALLFMAGKMISASSHLVAVWLAARIGLVNTMVFTHIPSSLILIAIALTDSLPMAITLYLLREGLAEMDVPTRQSYVMAMVAPQERTFASGITSLARMAAWAIAPLVAGYAMQHASLSTPLLVAAALKILYDLLLWAAFRKLPPPEERRV